MGILWLIPLSHMPTRTGFFCWLWKIVHIIKLIIGPKYNGKYLHKIINDLLGETRVKETLTNVVIPTYDVKCVKPTIFSTFKVQILNLVYVMPLLIVNGELIFLLWCRQDLVPWWMLVLLMCVLGYWHICSTNHSPCTLFWNCGLSHWCITQFQHYWWGPCRKQSGILNSLVLISMLQFVIRCFYQVPICSISLI